MFGFPQSQGQREFKVEQLIAPGLYDNTTVLGSIDLNGKDGSGLVVALFVGATDIGASAVEVQDSADNSTWTTIGTFGGATLSGTSDNTQYLQFLQRNKVRRYLRVRIVVLDGTLGMNLSAQLFSFGNSYLPSSEIPSSFGSGVTKVGLY